MMTRSAIVTRLVELGLPADGRHVDDVVRRIPARTRPEDVIDAVVTVASNDGLVVAIREIVRREQPEDPYKAPDPPAEREVICPKCDDGWVIDVEGLARPCPVHRAGIEIPRPHVDPIPAARRPTATAAALDGIAAARAALHAHVPPPDAIAHQEAHR